MKLSMKITAAALAQLLGGEVEGNGEVLVDRPARIEDATPGSISFLANSKYEAFAYTTQASILLVDRQFKPTDEITLTLVRVANVYEAMAKLAEAFDSKNERKAGISPHAIIHEGAKVDETATIGDFVVVMPGAIIGPRSEVHPFVFVGSDCRVGSDCVLHSGVKLEYASQLGNEVVIHANTVIGSDGFGFVKTDEGYQKMKQLGNVIIEDRVEIGANAVIDRASIGSTIIKYGAKLDNLIQIAHNVEIGAHTAIAAQAGVAGSSKIGDHVLIGGQAGVVGHLKIADGTQVQAQSGVTNSTEPGERLYGSPAMDYTSYLRSYAAFKNFRNILRDLQATRQQVKALENRLDQLRSEQ
ncbi:MAG: UDP-3-O-(3-hydroxymyristoyl)glucosamine N-acyltransferase [Saprospiraceae bacterium]|nr:UDP-3-O-(3-hydroxymyristoyl)glucosamine N-acyltransferase [Saprospiraceae bacterium]